MYDRKNEEKVLQRCLDSVYGVVDEIVIVDTGSTDLTKEIALKYTNKVYDLNGRIVLRMRATLLSNKQRENGFSYSMQMNTSIREI